MLCEKCHKSEATRAITVKENGVEKELYVCASCAGAKAGSEKPRTSEGGDLPAPLVEGLVKATLDFMKGVAEAEENERRTCPKCKSNWDTIKEDGRISCPTCWKTFAKKIRSEFLAAEFGPSHKGSAPSVDTMSDPSEARAALERELKDAVAGENYRRAAEIKRRLDAMDDGEGDGA